jgi:RHS repeat-associated protein
VLSFCTAPVVLAQDHPIVDAQDFQLNRDYFSQFPFEYIDTATGALILTFTDLVLPGHLGRDLKFQRTYNSKESACEAIAAGNGTTYALGADGRVWAWGANQFGQLGTGTTTPRAEPGLVPGLPAIRSLATSGYHTLAIAADGSVWSWGRNTLGQVGDMTETDRLTALQALQDGTLTPVEMMTPGTLDPGYDAVRYYHTDALGSVRVVTDAAGSVFARFDFTPFGEEVNPVSSSEGRRFTGQERESETGLDYFGARYYASQSGRMTTVDPVLDLDQALLDPQRWNRYAYSLNNPLKFTDPDGRSPKLAIMALKAGHALYKGYDIYSTVAGIVDAGGTVVSPDATAGERAWAGVQLAGELSGVTDLLKAGRGVFNAIDDGTSAITRAGKAYHHTLDKYVDSIKANGLRKGTFATPTEGLSPLQAQLGTCTGPGNGDA